MTQPTPPDDTAEVDKTTKIAKVAPVDSTETLSQRMAVSGRSVSDRDLLQVIGFLYETLGRWYELAPGGRPPSVELSNITLAARPSVTESAAGPGLLNEGTVLGLGSEWAPGPASRDDIVRDDVGGGETDEETDGESDEDETIADEREGVFVASATLAQVAVGRPRTDDETWDDIIHQLETGRRPALASALWVGLATEPWARYPSIGQWRRAVDAAVRSDTATSTMLDHEGESRRTPLLLAIGGLAVIAAVGAFLLFGGNGTAIEDADVTAAQPDAPTVTVTDADETDPGNEPTTDATGEDNAAGSTDSCSLVGPLGPITIDQVSEGAIVVAWAPTTEAVNILLNGAFVDTVPAEAFRYVIERLPLSDDPLARDTEYTVAVEPQSGSPSTACATTLANPIPGSEVLIGVTAPTGLSVIDSSARSITVGWDLQLGADAHNLYLDGTYLQFGDVGGSSTVGEENEFTFLDLEPDTTYEIGIRRIVGPNQSGLATITATTESE